MSIQRDPTPDQAPEAVFRLFDEIQSEFSSGRYGDDPALARTVEAFGVTLEELKVAEENLLNVNEHLSSTRVQLDAERLRYHSLFDLAPDGFLITDANGTILEANRVASLLFNVPQRFIVGKVIPNFVPESERRHFRSWLRDTSRRATSPAPWRFNLLPRNGVPTPVEVALRLAPPTHGRRLELVWLLRELSEREPYAPQWPEVPDRDGLLARAHAELHRYRALLDASPVVIYEADPADGRITYVGKQAATLLGYPPEAWTDAPGFLDERTHPDDRPTVSALRARQLRNGDDLEFEYRALAADDRIVWLRENTRFTAGPAPRVLGALVNISRRKRLERRLYLTRGEAESEARSLTHLLHLEQQLLVARDLASILKEVVHALAALLDSPAATLYLLDPDTQALELAASRGLDDDQHAHARVLNSPPVPSDGPVSSTNEPLPSCLSGFRTQIDLPLLDRDARPLGFVSVHFHDQQNPIPRHVEFAAYYARIAGPHLDDARRRQSARAHLDALRAAVDQPDLLNHIRALEALLAEPAKNPHSPDPL